MNIHNLVGMANRIGEFFQSMPDRHEAKHDIAQHISKFWEPRMREKFIAHIDDATVSELHPLVHEAVLEHREMLATKRSVAR